MSGVDAGKKEDECVVDMSESLNKETTSPRLTASTKTGPNPPALVPEEKEKDSDYQRQLVVAAGMFCFGAVGMTTGNKMAVEYLKDDQERSLPTTLVAMQMLGTLLLLAFNTDQINRSQLTWRHAMKWTVIFFWSGAGMFTSAESFVYANVSFVIIMRNLGTILTTAVEYFVRGRAATTEVIIAEVVIVIGVVIYGYSMLVLKHFWWGLFWCTANTVCVTVWSVLLKHKTENDAEIKGMNKYTMSFYNNLMGLPTFLILAGMRGEVALWGEILPNVSMKGWAVILSTCVIGYIISTSGFALTRLVSATSYQVVSNLCKVVNILLGLIVLGDRFPGWISISGCVIALGAGAWYSLLQAGITKDSSFKVSRVQVQIAVAVAVVCLFALAWNQGSSQVPTIIQELNKVEVSPEDIACMLQRRRKE